MIAEPVRWTPYVPPPDYWKAVRAACDKHGALLILDEIPNSLGRTGSFFTFEQFGVVPDMVVIGKPATMLLASELHSSESASNIVADRQGARRRCVADRCADRHGGAQRRLLDQGAGEHERFSRELSDDSTR